MSNGRVACAGCQESKGKSEGEEKNGGCSWWRGDWLWVGASRSCVGEEIEVWPTGLLWWLVGERGNGKGIENWGGAAAAAAAPHVKKN